MPHVEHLSSADGALAARIGRFVADCASAETGPGLFNPWRDVCRAFDLDARAPYARAERLIRHLIIPEVRLVLVGEAPGYQGCRYSGVPFCSEKLLGAGAIPRVPIPPGGRLTRRGPPWSEPSATIVWRTLYQLQLAEHAVLWNACPWHPEGAPDKPLSNRAPTQAEVEAGLPFLERLAGFYPDAVFAAVGKVAAGALGRCGVACTAVRHPARGGASEFAWGIAQLCAKEALVERA